MYVYLVQHALSHLKEVDPERGITPEGIKETERSAAFLADLNPSIRHIWCSQKRRAQETAALFADVLGIPEALSIRAGLAPNDPVLPLRSELEEGDEDTLVVGHLPFLSRLASLLLAGDQENEVIHFRNSGVVCLRWEGDIWTLQWAVTPEILYV